MATTQETSSTTTTSRHHQQRRQQLFLDETPQPQASDFLQLDFTRLPRFIGRSAERQKLNAIFEHLLQPKSKGQIVFVHGESGIGKSALILHLQDRIQQNNNIGYFVSGKVDQYQQATKPYGVFVDAVTDLCQQVLLQDTPVLNQIRKDLVEVLGHETTILTNLIPSLLDLLTTNNSDNNKDNKKDENYASISKEKEKDNSSLPNNDQDAAQQLQHDATTKTREQSSSRNLIGASTATSNSGFSFQIFVHLFRSFLKAFCKPTRPLILFLDDLQWADDGSRKLITSIAADELQENILIVGAYRDNDEAIYEFDSTDTNCQFSVTDIQLGPLSKNDFSEIISTITGISQTSKKNKSDNDDKENDDDDDGDDAIDLLSNIVVRKTGGNIFFALQYLEALYRAQLIFYDFGISRWNWNLEQIKKSTSVSDNIVGLLIGKLQSLDQNLQDVLMFAACLGFTFDVHVLHGILISEQKLSATQADEESYTLLLELLAQLTKEGLVHIFNTQKYQFVHDRVQQSAYSLFPKGKEGDELHVRVGRQILDYYNTTMQDETWMLFRAVDLLTPRHEQMQQQQDESKLELVQLNVQSAKKAIEQMAFLPAAKYVKNAIGMMDPNTMWDDHYDITLEVYNLHAKMQHACGDYSDCLHAISIILDKAHCLQDKLPAYVLRVTVKGMSLEMDQAIAEGKATLKILGVKLPKHPTILHVLLEYSKTNRILKKRTAKDLVWLPAMTDPVKIAMMRLLTRIVLNCNETEQIELMFVACIKMARMTIKYGLCGSSMFALAGYGVIHSVMGHTKAAFEYAPLIMELLKRPETKSGYPGGVHLAYAYLDHLKNPVQDGMVPVLQGYRVGMEHGEVEFSILCLLDHIIICTTVGMPLNNLERQLQSYCGLFQEFGQNHVLGYSLPYYQFTLNLAGKSSNPLVLTGHAMNETELLQKLKKGGHKLGITFLRNVRMMIRYIFGAYDSADLDRQYLDKVESGDTYIVRYFTVLYCGLTCLAMARKYPRKKKKYIKAAQSHIAVITKYVKDGSVNGAPMLKLLQAEMISLQKERGDSSVEQHNKVKDAYQAAIQFNRRSGFRILTGVALERAGEYFASLGDVGTSEEYLTDAYLEFEDLCAFGKCKLMQEKFPWLMDEKNNDQSTLSMTSNNHPKNSNRSRTSKKMQANVLNSLKDRGLNRGSAESVQSSEDDNYSNWLSTRMSDNGGGSTSEGVGKKYSASVYSDDTRTS